MYLCKDFQRSTYNQKLIFLQKWRFPGGENCCWVSRLHYFHLEFIALASKCVIRRGAKFEDCFSSTAVFKPHSMLKNCCLTNMRTNEKARSQCCLIFGENSSHGI